MPRKQVEHREEDVLLNIGAPRLPQRVSHGEGNPERARRSHLVCDLPQKKDGDARDSSRLDAPLDQAHGLIAHGSDRREEDPIHRILPQLVRHLGS